MDSRITGLELKTSLRAIADLALPRTCAVCGCTLRLNEEFICNECRAGLPETMFSSLVHNPMADRFNDKIRSHCDSYEPYAYAAALFFYNSESAYKHIPPMLKYYRRFATGKHFAGMLADRLCSAAWFSDVDAVVPVPLHWTRYIKRGYNQASVVASVIASALPSARFFPRLLKRRRRTRTQTRLSVSDKRLNVSGAFCVRKSIPGIRHVLLIDDVFTTGATLSECHRALRSVYGRDVRISVATLAYVSS